MILKLNTIILIPKTSMKLSSPPKKYKNSPDTRPIVKEKRKPNKIFSTGCTL
jgi:hypothetical protein